MAKKKSGNFLGQIIAFLVIGSAIFWFFKTPVPGSLGSAEYWKNKSAATSAWANSIVAHGDISRIWKGIDGLVGKVDGKEVTFGKDSNLLGGSGQSNKGVSTASAAEVKKAKAQLDKLKTGGSPVDYDRNDWKHWVSAGQSCWNTREEVLARDAVKGSVVYLDKDKKETKSKSKACSIESGKWNDPYTGKQVTNPGKLDIDHLIPLSYAAQHGGQSWSAKKKEEYANNLKVNYHLLAVDASANRIKSDKGPSKWKPSNQAFHCSYATDWILVSQQWGLSVDKADKQALASMLKTCGK